MAPRAAADPCCSRFPCCFQPAPPSGENGPDRPKAATMQKNALLLSASPDDADVVLRPPPCCLRFLGGCSPTTMILAPLVSSLLCGSYREEVERERQRESKHRCSAGRCSEKKEKKKAAKLGANCREKKAAHPLVNGMCSCFFVFVAFVVLVAFAFWSKLSPRRVN